MTDMNLVKMYVFRPAGVPLIFIFDHGHVKPLDNRTIRWGEFIRAPRG